MAVENARPIPWQTHIFRPNFEVPGYPDIYRHPGLVQHPYTDNLPSGFPFIIGDDQDNYGIHWKPDYSATRTTCIFHVSQSDRQHYRSGVILPGNNGSLFDIQIENGTFSQKPLQPITMFSSPDLPERQLCVYASGEKMSAWFSPTQRGLPTNDELLRLFDTVSSRFRYIQSRLPQTISTSVDISQTQVHRLQKAFSDRNIAGSRNGLEF